jgi:hypothetical protein
MFVDLFYRNPCAREGPERGPDASPGKFVAIGNFYPLAYDSGARTRGADEDELSVPGDRN